MNLSVDVFSDAICPWCFIGKRRLEKALSSLNGRHEIEVAWHPFQLNPEMPRKGLDRKTYRTAKFGSWERSLALDAGVEKVGVREGIAFAHDRIQRTPNTFDAHRLVWLAGQKGLQDAMVEALFHSYFIEGVDVGDPGNLVDIAVAAGLDAKQAEDGLNSGAGAEVVREEENEARRLGVSSVPLFLINGRHAVSGAQEAGTLISAFDRVAELEGSEMGVRRRDPRAG